MFGPVGQVADFHDALGQFVTAINQGKPGTRFGRGLELLPKSGVLERIFNPPPRGPQGPDVGEGHPALRFPAEHHKNIGRIHECRRQSALFE